MKTIKASPIIILTWLCFFTVQAVFPESAKAQEERLNQSMEEIENGTDDKPEESLDRILEGFETHQEQEDSRVVDAEESAIRKDHGNGAFVVSLNGYASLRSTCNYAHKEPGENETDWRGLSSLRSEIMLKVDTKLGKNWSTRVSGRAAYDAAYDINGRTKYTDDIKDNYIKEVELLETYVQGSPLSHLDVKAGRQVVVWGKLDNIRVTDILNPLDLREFGVTDIEDIRLPLNMLKIDGYLFNWTLSGITIPEIRFNKNPEYGSDFYPVTSPPIHEEIPENGLDHMEYAFSAGRNFSGWDIAFYWADIYNDTPHMKYLPGIFQMELTHERINLYGTAVDMAFGDWLLIAETAHLDGLKYFNTADDAYSRTDIGAGIEFSGFKETTLGIEGVRRYIHAYDEVLKNEPDNQDEISTQTAVRLTKNWLNETFSLTIVMSAFGTDFKKGSLQRYELVYDISDDLTVKGGLVAYQSGSASGFNNIGDNDRVFLELKYSF